MIVLYKKADFHCSFKKPPVKISVSKRTTIWSFIYQHHYKPPIKKNLFNAYSSTFSILWGNTNKKVFTITTICICTHSEEIRKILSKTSLHIPILDSKHIILNKESKQSLRECSNDGILWCSKRSYPWRLWISVWVPCGVFVVIQRHLRRRWCRHLYWTPTHCGCPF